MYHLTLLIKCLHLNNKVTSSSDNIWVFSPMCKFISVLWSLNQCAEEILKAKEEMHCPLGFRLCHWQNLEEIHHKAFELPCLKTWRAMTKICTWNTLKILSLSKTLLNKLLSTKCLWHATWSNTNISDLFWNTFWYSNNFSKWEFSFLLQDREIKAYWS